MAGKGVETHTAPQAKKRVKTTSDAQTQTPHPLAVDRISTLPNSLIQHILSFLPIFDAVRTSLLSRRWRRMWYSVPTLCFNGSDIDFGSPKDREGFYNYVDNCLKHLKIGMGSNVDSVNITSFKLDLRPYGRSNASYLDNWLAFVVESKVKELNLSLEKESSSNRGRFYHYSLPEMVVNARNLTIMELKGLGLSTSCTFSLPSLKTLSLVDVLLADAALDNLLLGCPSLEKFLLSDCSYLRFGRFRSSSLRFLEIESTGFLSMQVEAINLESFVLFDVCCHKMNLSACRAIRNVSLSDFSAGQSLDFLSELPLLENLTMSKCDGLDHIKISSHHLRSFYLNNNSEVKVTVRLAPNLALFRYNGNLKFSLSMESPNLLNGSFIIHEPPESYDANWYIDLINFLLNLNCSWNIISLHVHSDEALILPEYVRRVCRSPMLNWKHLKVMTTCEPKSKSDLRDALFWFSPSLETLSINQINYK
ncbi:F-box domain containing protein [Trema orientale]|uniref:F-box domain containing protein n=1 Tax=Trema orientale TaxID=63057 RepID=A0A2P5D5W8_TREOI|nr:F-box domain containing protein [Trema orientale]